MGASEEHIAFYKELGLAVTQWAQLEMSLFHLLCTCFNRSQYSVVYSGFISMEGFRAKLRFVSNVFCQHITDTAHLADWRKADAKLESLSRSRNKLAHWRQHIYTGSPIGRRYALVPWALEPKTITQKESMRPPSGALCVRDINSIRFNFFAVNVALVNLRCRILHVAEAVDKSAETPLKPLTLAQMSKDIRTLVNGTAA